MKKILPFNFLFKVLLKKKKFYDFLPFTFVFALGLSKQNHLRHDPINTRNKKKVDNNVISIRHRKNKVTNELKSQ